MQLQMKIQSLDAKGAVRGDPAKLAGGKSRLKRLFERQFPNVLRIYSAEKLAGERDEGEMEPNSVCLDRMVLSFIEESNEKTSRSRCNCFNGNFDDRSDDEVDSRACDAPPIISSVEILKGLVPCVSVIERNLLADASNIVESKIGKEKDDCRRIVADGLRSLGYDASVCKSRWERTPSFPAGEYEYVDVIVDGERLLMDVDFRSEFEIARSTKAYRAVLQSLPSIFVGKADRLQQIIAVVSEAARQSLKKKGLHYPPWRKPEYMRAKWLAPYQRTTPAAAAAVAESAVEGGETGGGDRSEEGKVKSEGGGEGASCPFSAVNFSGEFEMRIDEDPFTSIAKDCFSGGASAERITVVVSPWHPPAVRPKAAQAGARGVTGLASVLRERP